VAKYQLTSPEGQKYEIEAPDDAPQEQVLEYFAKQTGHKPEVGTGEATALNALNTFSMGLWKPYAAAVSTAKDQFLGSREPFSENYARNYQREQARDVEAKRNVGARIVGDTAGLTAQTYLTLPAKVAMTSYEAAKEAARPVGNALSEFARGIPDALRYGIGFTTASKLGEEAGNPQTTIGRQAAATGEGIVEGAIAGPLTYAGFYGFGQGLGRYQRGREARADQNAVRAAELRDVGIDQPFAPAVTNNGIVQTGAKMVGAGVGGSPVGQLANRNVEQMQTSLNRLLGQYTGYREAGDLGADVQGVLRRNLLEYSRPHHEIQNMGPEEAARMTGIAPAERRMPPRPVVEPVKPEFTPMTPDEYLAKVASEVPEVKPSYPQERVPVYPEEPTGAPMPSTDAMRRLQDIRTKKSEIENTIQNVISPNRDEVFKKVFSDSFFNSPQFMEVRGLFDEMASMRPKSPQVLEAWQKLPRDITSRLEPYREFVRLDGERDAAIQQLRQINQEYVRAQQDARRTAAETRQTSIQQARQLADDEAKRLSAADRQAAELEATKATEAARQKAIEDAKANADDMLFWLNRRAEQEAERKAQERTAELQAKADAEHSSRIAGIKAQQRPFRIGTTPETYKTETEAAYSALFNNAPPIQANPLGSKGSKDTATGRLLAEIGAEARQALKLEGFNGSPWDDRGAIKPELLRHIQSLAGRDVGERLSRLSDMRANGQFPPNIEGFHRLRSAVGKAVGEAKRESLRNGTPMSVDEQFMSRLLGALTKDMRAALLRAGPEGQQTANAISNIDAQYKAYRNDIVKPLAKVFGDNVTPVQALDRLVKFAERGETRELGAFMRVMREKNDPLRGTSAILYHMTDGGRDMRVFLDKYTSLPQPTRAILFEGEQGQALQSALNRYVSAARRLEPFLNTARHTALVNPSQITHFLTLAAIFTHWPQVVAMVGGNAMAARLLTSTRYLRWLTEVPVASRGGFDTAAFSKHLARLGAVAGEQKEIGEALKIAFQDAIGITPAHALFAGEGAKTADKEALAEAKKMKAAGKSDDEIIKATGWFFDDGRWNFETKGSPSVKKNGEDILSDAPAKYGDMIEHKSAFDAYPWLAMQMVSKSPAGDMLAGVKSDGLRNALSPMFVTTDSEQRKMLRDPFLLSTALPHETQHQVDNMEGRAKNWREDHKKPYEQRRSERRAYNASYRDKYLSDEEKRNIPPWMTEADAMETWRRMSPQGAFAKR
jgi:hypothetical protein